MRQFLRYFWGTIVRPGPTFEALALERGVRWAVALACLPVLQIWGNILLHAAFGHDWLGTRGILPNPTYVGGFGHLQVGLESWVPIFAALMPFLALFGLAFTPGAAHLLSKLWGGKGTFEQMVNTLAFATIVPNLVIGATTEWLFGVPIDLLSGQPYWWTAAMYGKLGPIVGTAWNTYVFGVYIGLQYLWMIVLGSLAIRRVQRVPRWAAVLVMLVLFGATMLVDATFVR